MIDQIDDCAKRATEHMGLDPDEMIEIIGTDDLTSAELLELRNECGEEGIREIDQMKTFMPRWRSMRREAEKALISVAWLQRTVVEE